MVNGVFIERTGLDWTGLDSVLLDLQCGPAHYAVNQRLEISLDHSVSFWTALYVKQHQYGYHDGDDKHTAQCFLSTCLIARHEALLRIW